jgi:hypothetical protein
VVFVIETSLLMIDRGRWEAGYGAVANLLAVRSIGGILPEWSPHGEMTIATDFGA